MHAELGMHATRGIRPKPKIEAPYPSAYRRSEAIDPLNEGLYSNLIGYTPPQAGWVQFLGYNYMSLH